jgi:dGTPase
MSHHRLTTYAARPEESRGRRVAEPEHPYRDCWDRDRDRVVHSRAFRRLEYKTQVFPNHEGDHFRTRLTHTIEVAGLARTVARTLGLNSTLAEAIALTHDIGHPPFGHVGEEALDALMQALGGFEHNRHTLRTVDELENKYAAFRGLNLTYEVREGIAKHSTRYDRFQHAEMLEFHPDESPTLEAQLIDLVDHIAYNVHDIDDGVEAHILSVAQLASEVPLFGRLHHRLRVDLAGASERALFNETIRRLIDRLVTDLIHTTRTRVADAGVETLADVRGHRSSLAAHSDLIDRELDVLSAYLEDRLYRSPRVAAEMDRARTVLAELFRAYDDNPGLLPPRHQQRCEQVGKSTAIADYVAGMTDRFVLREHERLVRLGGGPIASTRYDG